MLTFLIVIGTIICTECLIYGLVAVLDLIQYRKEKKEVEKDKILGEARKLQFFYDKISNLTIERDKYKAAYNDLLADYNKYRREQADYEAAARLYNNDSEEKIY